MLSNHDAHISWGSAALATIVPDAWLSLAGKFVFAIVTALAVQGITYVARLLFSRVKK